MVKPEEAMHRKSRVTVPLDRRLEVRLASYALCAGAAGVGMLAPAQRADAQIIYTPADKTVTCRTAVFGHHCLQEALIDFDHDGRPEFRLIARYTQNTNTVLPATGTGSQAAFLSIYPHVRASVIPNRRSEPAALQAGSSIGPNQKWRSVAGFGFLADTVYHPVFGQCSPGTGLSWNNVQRRFLGLRFMIEGRTYYAWAELTTKSGSCTVGATLQGYAYNSAPGQPILAGETQDDSSNGIEPPKQPTLGALALGSLGLPLWRQESSAGSH